MLYLCCLFSIKTMGIKSNKVIETLKPYKGIIYFIVLLLGTHFLWKLVVDGNLHGQEIAVFGIDMTPQFHDISLLTTKAVYWFVHLFPGSDTFIMDGTLLRFTDGSNIISIIWGCTGVKQLYIFLVIMLFYSGPWKKKLWYIPMGCIILSAYNIFRIACICWLTKEHPERFEFLHEGLFRYIYYGLIFLLWVIWEEAFVRRTEKKTSSSYSHNH